MPRPIDRGSPDAPGGDAGGVPVHGGAAPGTRHSDAEGGDAGSVLVIGYGNALRSDDGIGWHAAVRLEELARTRAEPRLAGVEVLARHQLTPELAADMAGASLVILVDASADLEPGAIAVRPLTSARGGPPQAAPGLAPGGMPRAGPGAVAGSGPGGTPGASTHHVGAAELLALARELFGTTPETWEVAIGMASTELGADLTPAVAAALPAVVEEVAELVRGRRRPPPGP